MQSECNISVHFYVEMDRNVAFVPQVSLQCTVCFNLYCKLALGAIHNIVCDFNAVFGDGIETSISDSIVSCYC